MYKCVIILCSFLCHFLRNNIKSHDDFDSADPSSMQDACGGKMTFSSCSSVDRAPARCSGDRGFDSCRGLKFFLLARPPAVFGRSWFRFLSRTPMFSSSNFAAVIHILPKVQLRVIDKLNECKLLQDS